MTQSTSEFVLAKGRLLKTKLEDLHECKYEDGQYIQVCAGEWRPDPADPAYYLFWEDPDWSE